MIRCMRIVGYSVLYICLLAILNGLILYCALSFNIRDHSWNVPRCYSSSKIFDFNFEKKINSHSNPLKILGGGAFYVDESNVHVIAEPFIPLFLINHAKNSYVVNRNGVGVPSSWIVEKLPTCVVCTEKSFFTLSRSTVNEIMEFIDSLIVYFPVMNLDIKNTYFVLTIPGFPPLKVNKTITQCLPFLIQSLQKIQNYIASENGKELLKKNLSASYYLDLQWFCQNRRIIYRPIAERALL